MNLNYLQSDEGGHCLVCHQDFEEEYIEHVCKPTKCNSMQKQCKPYAKPQEATGEEVAALAKKLMSGT